MTTIVPDEPSRVPTSAGSSAIVTLRAGVWVVAPAAEVDVFMDPRR
ncbi:hypothetical protein Rhow_007330 [Rhodococcus wratislaviensis]|uniref:Uncharacterized protein n=1 Tax=Rhodococcus wratislaviensis TaxID=44752 RepID=A0A402CHW0_RHOWR|nr:hypothetical protein Rhow_007330 [Rhodococcus wratislaviensis]